MMKRWHTSKRLRDARNLLIALPLLTGISIIATIWAAVVDHHRINWLFCITLAFLLLTCIFFKRVRNAFKTLPSYRARRKRADEITASLKEK